MKRLRALIAALAIAIAAMFIGGAPAHALTGGLVANGCHYQVTVAGNGGSAYCNSWDSTGASGYATHVRVMIICQSESATTGWLYGPWKYAYYAANRIPAIRTDNSTLYCGSNTQHVVAITLQLV